MARDDRRKKGGRVTPKGGAEARRAVSKGHGTSTPEESTRYTAPIPQELKVSPPWVPILMFALLIVGSVVIILNYLGLLPGATDNRYLLVGLIAILGGIITATQFH